MSKNKSAAIETKRLMILVGSNIRERRNQLNMTQERTAELANINEKHLSAVENGKEANLSIGYLVSIAMALDTSILELLPAEST